MSSSETVPDRPSEKRPSDLTASGITIPSDSENYGNNELSPPSPQSTESSPLILYKPPTVWSLVRGAAINLLLPFVNGLMLGFGELFAHEVAFRLGWSETKVCTASANGAFKCYCSTFAYLLLYRFSQVGGQRDRPVQGLKSRRTSRRANDGRVAWKI